MVNIKTFIIFTFAGRENENSTNVVADFSDMSTIHLLTNFLNIIFKHSDKLSFKFEKISEFFDNF